MANRTGDLDTARRRPYPLGAILDPSAEAPDAEAVRAALANLGVQARVFEPQGGERWVLRWSGGAAMLKSSTVHLPSLRLLSRDLEPELAEAVEGAELELQVWGALEKPVLEAFQEQLRRLRAIAPEALALHDPLCQLCRPWSWLLDATASSVPPAPDCLYTIHAVAGERGTVWMHTHGLERCDAPELELMDVPAEDANTLSMLLTTAAMMFIEGGVPNAREPFAVGHGMDLMWLPWEEALDELGPGDLGRHDDREDHGGDRGVLLVPGRKRLRLFGKAWRPVDRLVPILEDNPVLWVSKMETERMELLAQERFETFAGLVERLGESGDWLFLAKVGYPVDGAEPGDSGNREHLWFEVQAVDGGELEGTLINQPYHVARLNEGDSGRHPVEWVSDWSVRCPLGAFGPDRIGLLFDQLQGGGG